MTPRQWFAPTQTMALAELRLLPSLFRWSHKFVDTAIEWDGIPDRGFAVRRGGHQLDLFADSSRGVGHSPTANQDPECVSVDGLVVDECPSIGDVILSSSHNAFSAVSA
ncbi:hypothetical protein G7Y82_11650 [Solimonas sp. C16B3]|uniref:Uncharacterized protein n=2 Tax=Solimonas marina TaxID=2714601 RepID=A0A969WBC2_9GAMM|nr:hypothetical protein [Solimonas marina]